MTPPRLAEALLRRALPSDDSGLSVTGDLRHEFGERCTALGPLRARLWYWRQACSIWWWSAWRHPHQSHHQPRGGAMFDVIGDLRHSWRTAAQSPGQTAVIVLTLAIAIAVTTIGFAFADTVFLRGLPIAEPQRTVIVYGVSAQEPDRRGGLFFDDYLDVRERTRTVLSLSTWNQMRATLRRDGTDASAVTISRVSGDLFGVWGLQTTLGRSLRPGDDAPGAPPVAVLANHYWRDQFGGVASAVGQTLSIDGVAHEVVGVLGPEVEFGSFANISLWASRPLVRTEVRDAGLVVATGTLAAGATAETAAAEFAAFAEALAAEHPTTNHGRQLLVLPAHRAMGGPNLYLVMTLLVGTAALVMVIASANVAGVLMARAVARRREFGLRVALGARASRVFRQLISEGLLLALLGGIGGLMAAEGGLRLIRSVDGDPIFQQIVLDTHEVVFVLCLALAAPMLFSIAPALTAFRLDLAGVLNATGARSGGSGGRARQALVVAQLALAIMLATVGGLVTRTALAMTTAPTGFNPSNVLTFVLAVDQYSPEVATRRRLVSEVRERLSMALDREVGAMDLFPTIGVEQASTVEPDATAAAPGQPERWAYVISVDDQALAALGVPLLAGRWLTRNDIDTNIPVALVSAETARRYFGDVVSALGRRLTIRTHGVTQTRQVIGVTGDVRNVEPERGIPPRVWLPLASPRAVGFVVRASDDTRTAAEAVRRIARELAPAIPVESLETYDQAISRRGASDRVAMGMLISFAAVAVLFAAIGLYGSVALSVSMRRTEFGTRFALGAQVRDVAGMVLAQAFRLLAVGLGIGLAAGLAAGGVMRRMLYGVTPLDPFNVLGVIALLTAVTLIASAMPAWRAARVDVIAALR